MEKRTECEIVQDLLLGYVDNVLNLESKKLVEKHLTECTNCQKKLEEIKLDLKESENSQKQEIDYLKKVRRRTKIKSLLMAIGIIFIICFILFLCKFIIINNIMSKAEKSLEANNFYKETIQVMSDGKTSVTKKYFKDGKYKSVWELYSDTGVEKVMTQYSTVNSDEILIIYEGEKKVTIEKGEITKILNTENNLKFVPFVQGGVRDNIVAKLGIAFVMSINTDTYDIGREYYVLKNKFEQNQRWEMWIDKETGLPLKEINKDGTKTFYAGTEVVKEIADNTQEYKYEFGVVTDEDVKIPDLTSYEIDYKNNEETYGLLE